MKASRLRILTGRLNPRLISLRYLMKRCLALGWKKRSFSLKSTRMIRSHIWN